MFPGPIPSPVMSRSSSVIRFSISNSPSAALSKRSTASWPFSRISQAAPSTSKSSNKISALISLSSATNKWSPSMLSWPADLSSRFSVFCPACISKIFSLKAETKKGLVRTPTLSSWKASASTTSPSYAVKNRMGTGSATTDRICLAVSIPSISGIFQSNRIMW